MDLYSRKQRWKLLLALVALAIVGASLWYSSRMVERVRTEERRKVQLWAEAVRNRAQLVNYTDSLFRRLREEERKKVELLADAMRALADNNATDLAFYLRVVSDNTTVPMIIVDEEGTVIAQRNLKPGMEQDPDRMQEEVRAMGRVYKPITIPITGTRKQFLYYKDSRIVTELEQVMDNIIRNFISETVMNAAAVPVVLTDSARRQVVLESNVDSALVKDSARTAALIAAMEQVNPPIRISLAGRGTNWILYDESRIVRQLRYYPYVMFGIIGLFLLVSYALFSLFRNAEQNQVWVGMAKETAHQLGTPLSSLMGWVEVLGAGGADGNAVSEMRKDVDRLEVITERFSKIGSAPDLVPEKLYHTLRATVLYLRGRLPARARIEVVPPSNVDREVPLNRALFSWVIENLIRNAVDAMGGEGAITIEVHEDDGGVHVDVTDTGKGIPPAQHRTVFQPGFTTKKRGWGLGLSLSKRIIEQYHGGRIFVKRSAPGKGTTFRITLKA